MIVSQKLKNAYTILGDFMNKYKICVYAICKNESKFIKRWYESIKEADYICVLDTGSDDNSIDILKELGINYKTKIIEPFRFDEARNESLKMIPDDIDICICLDIDEVMKEGWYKIITDNWNDTLTRLSYIYNWNLDENDNPIISFYANKIHKNKCYKWTHPVHEVLTYTGNDDENILKVNHELINHYPDKEKSRNQYLPLLELSVKEDPLDDRNMHYLGREYMYYGKWNECIDTLIKHLNLKSATWKDERSASMRYISRCYINLNRWDEATMWLEKAIAETPYLREPYIEMALLKSKLNKFEDVIKYSLQALNINSNTMTYINENFSGDKTIYDLLSLGYYYTNDKENALKYINKALELDPTNDRLLVNKRLMET